jgi:hypothetical protein
MPGARCTRGRACRVVSTRVSHHGRTGITRHSRTRWFYGLFRALPGDRALLSPSLRGVASAKLDASVGASGPHDFAVRKPALSSAAPPASIASQPYVRDDRETPLCVGRDGEECRSDLGKKGTRIFLRRGLDRRTTDLPVGQMLPTKCTVILTALYKRLADAGKSHKPALVACARKLVIFANTVAREIVSSSRPATT